MKTHQYRVIYRFFNMNEFFNKCTIYFLNNFNKMLIRPVIKKKDFEE